MKKQPKWEPGYDGHETPYDYGWYRGTLDEPFLPDVWFEDKEDFNDYADGYNEAHRINDF